MGVTSMGASAQRKASRRSSLLQLPALLVCACFLFAALSSNVAAADRGRALQQGEHHPWQAFAMTLAAGSSTGLGALLVFCVDKLDPRVLSMTMAFSSGVMIYVSLVEVIQVSFEKFRSEHSHPWAYMFATGSFFAGAVIMAITDDTVHHIFDAVVTDHKRRQKKAGGSAQHLEGGGFRGDAEDDDSADESPDEALAIESALGAPAGDSRLIVLTSAIVGLAIALHNIPEGMATYIASFHSIPAGAPLTIAIAVHNIPEGLAVAMPLFHGTGNRMTAIFWASLSGMAEPLGAFLSYLFVNPGSSESSFGAMFAISAGMMVYVCLAELLPAAYREHPSAKMITQSFFAGCLVMASSLVIEKFQGADGE